MPEARSTPARRTENSRAEHGKRLRGGTEAPPHGRVLHPHEQTHMSSGPADPRCACRPAPAHHRGEKSMATFLLPCWMAVNAEPLTWAVLLWFEAP
ncbi:hypothetical protein GCM10014715_43190 [Streptomyces spiralis]|uniref:Uncharacterized protein n=1 Tax=Streptomyces spiralis TaxID=66376 RepID=A0A919A226_9ACTN|nr:hypothetical protein GCM10014715_43190 [Streptomyces spiralis]